MSKVPHRLLPKPSLKVVSFAVSFPSPHQPHGRHHDASPRRTDTNRALRNAKPGTASCADPPNRHERVAVCELRECAWSEGRERNGARISLHSGRPSERPFPDREDTHATYR